MADSDLKEIGTTASKRIKDLPALEGILLMFTKQNDDTFRLLTQIDKKLSASYKVPPPRSVAVPDVNTERHTVIEELNYQVERNNANCLILANVKSHLERIL